MRRKPALHCDSICGIAVAVLLCLSPLHSWAYELKIRAIESVAQQQAQPERPEQLPHSRIAAGQRNIRAAWLANPTTRYRHGVLGDNLEATKLMVETAEGKQRQLILPASRVFEDLVPRLVDLDGDGHDEIIVVESDTAIGASLVIYAVISGQLKKIAATPFIGTPNRWLNPVGVGDFDGDGKTDVALVETPHIGGILKLYRFDGANLSLFAQYPGVSTHRIGSTELGLGRVVTAKPGDLLLLPDQSRRTILLLGWAEGGINVLSRVRLPAPLTSSLVPSEVNRWQFQTGNGKHYEIRLTR